MTLNNVYFVYDGEHNGSQYYKTFYEYKHECKHCNIASFKE
jgi:hypothetical protein